MSVLPKTAEDVLMSSYEVSDDIGADAKRIIEDSQKAAHSAVNVALVARNWLLGKRIADEILRGSDSAEYGANIVVSLAKRLTREYGRGFSKTNLYQFLGFYRAFPNIFQTASGKSTRLLSWSHYCVLIQIADVDARAWYESEALSEHWSVRTMQRNVDSQYYYRLLASQDKGPVRQEMRQLTANYQADKLEFVKNPVVTEFLGLPSTVAEPLRESRLEQSIIDNLQKFLLELGKGYAFIARQKHIHTRKQEYYIDLVFYNYLLKCFVLIDLKTSKITHQDIGQMDMYVRMYDELIKDSSDGPTLGIVLCAETDEDIARYSVLHGNEQLFASKYLTYLPSEEDLRAEIEAQKALFYLQQGEQREADD